MQTIQGSKSVGINNKIYIFGGNKDSIVWHDEMYLNYLYEFNTTTCNLAKIDLIPIDSDESNVPSERKDHSMVAIGSNIYIFGGYNGTSTYLGDLYKIDTTNSNSTKIDLIGVNSAGSNIPSVRKDHSMVAIGYDIYIFGGNSNNFAQNDLYKIETNDTNMYYSTKITLIPIDGYDSNIPTLRSQHSMVAIESNIYIFGGYKGYDYNSGLDDYNNDLYKININNNISEKITLTGIDDDIPEKRANHYMVIVDNYIYILLGYNTDSGRLNDLYKIDTYGNSKKMPLSYFNSYANFNDLSQNFNITAINNDIYVFYLYLKVRIQHNIIESTTVYSGTMQPNTLLKITPTIRDHHLNGNIAELRINNVITSDSDIIDNYNNLNNNYNV
jgi:hypothetical protein